MGFLESAPSVRLEPALWERTINVNMNGTYRFEDQFDQALANLLAVAADAGGHPASIGKLTIFVTDCAEYVAARQAIGERYCRRMGSHYTAMTLVEVRALVEPGARVEIEGIAWI